MGETTPARRRRIASRPATRAGEPFEPVPESQVQHELGLDEPRPVPRGDDPLAWQRAQRPPHWE